LKTMILPLYNVLVTRANNDVVNVQAPMHEIRVMKQIFGKGQEVVVGNKCGSYEASASPKVLMEYLKARFPSTPEGDPVKSTYPNEEEDLARLLGVEYDPFEVAEERSDAYVSVGGVEYKASELANLDIDTLKAVSESTEVEAPKAPKARKVKSEAPDLNDFVTSE
jgi:hypothetical protein